MRRTILLITCGAFVASGCGSSSKAPAGSSKAHTTSTATSGLVSKHAKLTVGGTPNFAVPSPSAPVLSGVVKIAYRSFAINPDIVRVRSGSTVEWTNNDPTNHNVTSQAGPQRFASKDFGEGATFKVRLRKPGIYNYECTLHPATMNGTIQVLR
jgi:plastocyanin